MEFHGDDLFLTQHCKQFTRYHEGQSPTIDDLLLTQESGMIEDLQHRSPIGKSDHLVLIFNYILDGYISSNTAPRKNFNKADYDSIRTNLSEIDRVREFAGRSTDTVL